MIRKYKSLKPSFFNPARSMYDRKRAMAELQEVSTHVPRFLMNRSRVSANHNSLSASSLSEIIGIWQPPGRPKNRSRIRMASSHGKLAVHTYERHTYEVIRCSYEVLWQVERVWGRLNLSERSWILRTRRNGATGRAGAPHTARGKSWQSLSLSLLSSSVSLILSFSLLSFSSFQAIFGFPTLRFERCPVRSGMSFGRVCLRFKSLMDRFICFFQFIGLLFN